ncbi:hypothetical protein CCACVL1_19175, partial [Corchorus capsularis]
NETEKLWLIEQVLLFKEVFERDIGMKRKMRY